MTAVSYLPRKGGKEEATLLYVKPKFGGTLCFVAIRNHVTLGRDVLASNGNHGPLITCVAVRHPPSGDVAL